MMMKQPVSTGPRVCTVRISRSTLAIVLVAAATAWFAACAFAGDSDLQGTSSLPTVSHPELARPVHRPAPSEAPVEAPAAAAEEPARAPAGPRFTVNRIDFEGNTVLPAEDLAAVAKDYTGRQVSLSELRTMAKRIRKLYHSRGYILARVAIPPQKTKGKILRVIISEGKYGAVRVEGNKHYSSEFIQRMFSPATDNGVVREQDMQHSLLILNDYSDLTVKSLLVAGKEPGTADVLLKVKDAAPLHVGVDYNNFGNKFIGDNRAGIAFWGGNAITDGDMFQAHVIFPFPSSSDPIYQASYRLPIDRDGDSLALAYANAATTLGAAFAVLDVRSTAEIWNLSFQHPVIRTLKTATNLTGGLTSKSVNQSTLGVLAGHDELRLANVEFDGNSLWGKQRAIYSGTVTHGLGTAFGGLGNDNPKATLPGTGDTFTRLNGDMFYIRELTKTAFLLLRGSVQATDQPLTITEQFALGGPESVRGYQQSTFLGDEGYTASVEFRQSAIEQHDFNLQLALFVDTGESSLKRPAPGGLSERNLSGAGIGTRIGVGKSTSIRLDWGFPLTSRLATEDSNVLYAQLMSRW